MNGHTFSTTLMPRKVRIYKFTRDEYRRHYRLFIKSDENIMCQTFLEDEITLYKYSGDDDDAFTDICNVYDRRYYHIVNIHEDIPGIDHIGIVHHISGIFYKNSIPLLYVNTYAHNLILISEEFIDKAMGVLKMC
uniref:CASTOR ACT domain-containing protein n=1 Tax=viral metagenome TaxID=1070528 RepID=A0A6C0KD75_9ZZZZ